jgi:hypothetical protein
MKCPCPFLSSRCEKSCQTFVKKKTQLTPFLKILQVPTGLTRKARPCAEPPTQKIERGRKRHTKGPRQWATCFFQSTDFFKNTPADLGVMVSILRCNLPSSRPTVRALSASLPGSARWGLPARHGRSAPRRAPWA